MQFEETNSPWGLFPFPSLSADILSSEFSIPYGTWASSLQASKGHRWSLFRRREISNWPPPTRSRNLIFVLTFPGISFSRAHRDDAKAIIPFPYSAESADRSNDSSRAPQLLSSTSPRRFRMWCTRIAQFPLQFREARVMRVTRNIARKTVMWSYMM